MALEVIYGESRNRAAAGELAHVLEEEVGSGTVYLGYPVLATAEERVAVDALLVSPDHGLVAFLLADGDPTEPAEWENVVADQDRLFAILESHLRRHESLRKGRQLAVLPETATLLPSTPGSVPEGAEGFYGSLDDVPAWLADLPGIEPALERAVQGALQHVATIKPPKRRASVSSDSSRGAILKQIERGIANLDQWQKRAAIESPAGPQRIRGLAGSGKTVVLALKAAYWHTQHPDWNIAVTFHSRSLYQQIDDLVTRFTFEHNNDRPDTERLKIVHSWGSRAREGVYSMIAEALNETPRDWAYARAKYGMDDAFQGVCQELLAIAASRSEVEPIFDAVLIDEAQDLPPEFFQLVYRFTKEPKRIAWGYDELQKLSEATMPDTRELFGTGESGESLVSLEAADDAPRRDIVLPVCYRNTPWALATAHAIGIGVYRDDGLLQHPDEPHLWLDIGYEVASGALEPGTAVTLQRRTDSYPAYFPELLTPGDAVMLRAFDTEVDQDAWIADQIVTNLTIDELEADDILIVFPNPMRAKSRAISLAKALARRSIPSHLVGVNTSVDAVFQPGSVAMAHIYRAKGNEAPMVYAVDAQYAANSFNAVTRRNTLFTAITRSRAWVRVTGWGESMGPIVEEVERVFSANYKLSFSVPTADELARLRHVYRDRPPEHEASLRKATAGLTAFLEALERGEVDLEDLPPEMQERLRELRAQGTN